MVCGFGGNTEDIWYVARVSTFEGSIYCIGYTFTFEVVFDILHIVYGTDYTV